MFRVFLGLGSNLGDRGEYLGKAVEMVESIAKVTMLSSMYETEPVGMNAGKAFYNIAAGIQTNLNPIELLVKLKAIEHTIGRTPQTHMKPREIDIDILLYDGVKYADARLIVPHPHLVERRFALEPLSEIASNIIHPVLNKTITELLKDCKDRHRVARIGNLFTSPIQT
jgi:2-amino-4-hydroxy-6-hydroxymethyldihydropteridine diphosphokinase